MMSAARAMERALCLIGMACAGYLLLIAAQAQVFHHRAQHLSAADTPVGQVASGSVIGRIEIPDLHLSAAVLEDDQSKSLLRGLGHIRGTAGFGGLGNVGLAGHRDTFLRPLRRVAPGMQIRATNATGVYRYIIDSTEVVAPNKVDILDVRDRPELTLITCYPFNYVGAAPRRFIVRAHLVSVSPEAVAAIH